MTNSPDYSAEPSNLATQYETLRRAVLGEVLPPEARAGLMLFLRRGMWGWARALTTRCPFEQPTTSRPSNARPPVEYRSVIHIFAAMAIQTNS
jgi:hypothetical protein